VSPAGRPTRRALARSVLEVAPALLGAVVHHDTPDGGVAVRLTEVEAYAGQGQDEGSHAHRGPTRRSAVMFGPPGHAYVYFTYGMHWCVNVVVGPTGQASAVLLRAGAVVEGVELARQRRPAARTDRELARGPARLASALGVDGRLDGADLLDPSSPLRLLGPLGGAWPETVRRGPRVGLAAAADRPWRFWLADEPTVSPYRAAVARARG